MSTTKKPEFVTKFPHGKILALETKGGFKLFKGSSIAKYSAYLNMTSGNKCWSIVFIVAELAPNAGLLGSDDKEGALVDQWIHPTDTEISAPQEGITALLGGSAPYSKPVSLKFLLYHSILLCSALGITIAYPLHWKQLCAIGTVNAHLASHTFLVHEHITVATAIQSAVNWILDAKLHQKYGILSVTWRQSLTTQNSRRSSVRLHMLRKPSSMSHPLRRRRSPSLLPLKLRRNPRRRRSMRRRMNLPSLPSQGEEPSWQSSKVEFQPRGLETCILQQRYLWSWWCHWVVLPEVHFFTFSW